MDTLVDTLSGHTISFGHFSWYIHIIMSALYDAAEAGDLKRVQVLVEQRADKEKTGGSFGYTPLIIASYNGHLDVVRYLVEQGADIEKAVDYGDTPLIWASAEGPLEVVRYLLEQGADVNKTNDSGSTSLHMAAYHGNLEMAKLLMVYGADLNARNNQGQLPIEMGHRNTEEIRQAIRDEPQRRWDQQPHKRCVEQDRHPDAATSSASAQRRVMNTRRRSRPIVSN